MSSIFTKLKNNQEYKNAVIDSLLMGIPDNHIEILSGILIYVIDEKYELFDKPELQGFFYNDDQDELSDLILPSIRRLYGKTFINSPQIYKSDENRDRYKLFILYFNVDEFIEYLIDMLIKSKDILKNFEYIDKTAETLTLIVDNYIAMNIKKVANCEDVSDEIKRLERDLKMDDLLDSSKKNTTE